MALSLRNTNIKVVGRYDDAIGEDVKKEDYDAYLEDLDESRLKLEGQPSRFVLKKVLEFDMVSDIKNSQIKYKQPGKGQKDADFDIRVGSAMLVDVRAALIGIEHPEGTDAGDLVFEKADDGMASPKLIALLESYGMVTDLYKARQNAIGTPVGSKKRKLQLSSNLPSQTPQS